MLRACVPGVSVLCLCTWCECAVLHACVPGVSVLCLCTWCECAVLCCAVLC